MIICCGEALIDFIPTKDGKAYQPCPGGSILNIAVGLGRMGVPVGFLSRLSTDLFGEMLANHLTQNQVDLKYCPRIDGQTTLAFVSLQEDDTHEPEYAFYAEGAVDRELTVAELPARIDQKVSTLHFGSISLALEPGATAFETLMARESNRCLITLDPNVRPIVIDDRDAYRTRFEKWLAWVDILRLSQVDLAIVYPDHTVESLLQDWFDRGVSLVILTRGTAGSTGYLPDGRHVSVPTQEVKVKDTVGAGDSFFSAVLTFFYEHSLLTDPALISGLSDKDLADCLSFATKAAAINCTRAGANPPYRHEMDL